VFDIDGVLSDAAGRQHFIEGGGGRRKDWDAFFEACGDDPLIEEVGRLLELLDDDLQILLLTGRPIWVQPQTAAWLEDLELPVSGYLYLRPPFWAPWTTRATGARRRLPRRGRPRPGGAS
jgi:hypothetical protein